MIRRLSHRVWEASCRDLWSRVCLWGRRRWVPWESFNLSCWCSWRSLWPKSSENLQIHNQTCPKVKAYSPMHNCPQRNLYPQVHSTQASSQAPLDPMVSWPNSCCSWRVLWWKWCSGFSNWKKINKVETLSMLFILPIPGEAKAKAMPGWLYIHTK